MVYGTSQPMVSDWQACQGVLTVVYFFSDRKPSLTAKVQSPPALLETNQTVLQQRSRPHYGTPLSGVKKPFRKEEHMSVRVKINGKTFLLSMDEFMKLVYKMTPENPVNVLDFV